MFRLTIGDLWRGLIMAVAGPVMVAVFGVVGTLVSVPGFDVFSVDFGQLLKDLTNAMIIASYSAGAGYLLKNLLTDDNQHFLGIKSID